MATHGMIDLETLGTGPGTTVLTLGAVKFDPYTLQESHTPLYMHLDIEEQTEVYDRSISDDTMAWWSRQPQAIQDDAFGEHHQRYSVADTIKNLNRWCVGLDSIWCQGPTFDFVILEDFYRMAGEPCPWNYWQIRDSRTLFSLMPKDPRKAINFAAHNALEDCRVQALCVQQTYKHFQIRQV